MESCVKIGCAGGKESEDEGWSRQKQEVELKVWGWGRHSSIAVVSRVKLYGNVARR
jgi:hypothetical protein